MTTPDKKGMSSLGLEDLEGLNPAQLAFANDQVVNSVFEKIRKAVQEGSLENLESQMSREEKLITSETLNNLPLRGELPLFGLVETIRHSYQMHHVTPFFTLEARCLAQGNRRGSRSHIIRNARQLTAAEFGSYAISPDHHKLELDPTCDVGGCERYGQQFPVMASFMTIVPAKLAKQRRRQEKQWNQVMNLRGKTASADLKKYRRLYDDALNDELEFIGQWDVSGIGWRVKQESAWYKLADKLVGVMHSDKEPDVTDHVVADLFGIKILTGDDNKAYKVFQQLKQRSELHALGDEVAYLGANAKPSGYSAIKGTFVYASIPVEIQCQSWKSYIQDKGDRVRYQEKMMQTRLEHEATPGKVSPFQLVKEFNRIFGVSVYIPRESKYAFAA